MIKRRYNMRDNQRADGPDDPLIHLPQADKITFHAVIQGKQAKRLYHAIGGTGSDHAVNNQQADKPIKRSMRGVRQLFLPIGHGGGQGRCAIAPAEIEAQNQ